jgi:hypothetical protein
LGNRLIAHSPDAGWRLLYAVVMEEAPFETTEQGIRHPSFFYQLSHRSNAPDRRHSARARHEWFALSHPHAGPHSHALVPQRASEVLQVYLRCTLFTEAAAELYGADPEKTELMPRFAILDPLLEQLALASSPRCAMAIARTGSMSMCSPK